MCEQVRQSVCGRADDVTVREKTENCQGKCFILPLLYKKNVIVIFSWRTNAQMKSFTSSIVFFVFFPSNYSAASWPLKSVMIILHLACAPCSAAGGQFNLLACFA